MRHRLGIVASYALDVTTGNHNYMNQVDVSDDVIKWLEMHDGKLNENGVKIYICNAIEYIYLGSSPEPREGKLPINFFNPGKKNMA